MKLKSREISVPQEVDSLTDEPLLVIGYEKKRVIWTLFWPCSLGMLISLMIVFKWAFKDAGLMFWVMEIFGIVGVLGSLYIISELIYMESVSLYKDLLIVSYSTKFKKNKRVQLSPAKYSAISTPFFVRLVIADNLLGVQFDPSLFGSKDSKAFYETLSQISGKDIKELKCAFNSELISK